MDLSIVTTLYRSSSTLPEFYARAKAAAVQITPDHEIVLVNDGSPDDSLQVALSLRQKDPTVVVVDLSRNFGHHPAMMAGLSVAQGRRVFLLDGDLEEEPEWLLSFDELLNRETCDVIYGVQRRRKGDFFEKWSGSAFYAVFNGLSTTPIPANAVIARLMTRRYVDQLLKHHERELFLPGLWQATGYRQIPVAVTKHFKGNSTYTIFKRIALCVNAVTSFSEKPLFYIFYVGAAICAAAGMYIVWLLYLKWRRGIPLLGWSSLMVSIWFLGGLTIFFIGVVGVYVGKLYREIKQRPNAIVRELFRKN